MWENETVVLVTSLKKRLLGKQKTVRLERITVDNGVPTFIKDLFKVRSADYFSKENPLVVQSTPHFQIQPDEIASVQTLARDAVIERTTFSAEEVESILHEALVLRLDYLIKPVDTIRRILFAEDEKQDLGEIEARIGSFRKLLPYAERFISMCRKEGREAVEREAYDRLMTDVLHGMLGADPVAIVLQDFSVLTDFLSETKGEEVTRIEIEVIHTFLADRNLWGFRRALEVEKKLGSIDFNAVDLEMTLKRYLQLKEEFDKTETADAPDLPDLDDVVDQGMTASVEPGVDPASPEPEMKETVPVESNGWDLEDVMDEEAFDTSIPVPDSVAAEVPFEAPVEPEQMTETVDEGTTEVVQDEKEEAESPESQDTGPGMETPVSDGETGTEPKESEEQEAAQESSATGEKTEKSEKEPGPESAEEVVEKPEIPKKKDIQRNVEKSGREKREEKASKRKKNKEEAKPSPETPRDKGETEKEGDPGFLLEGMEEKKPTRGFRELVDAKTEKVFIKKLFGGEKLDYQELVNKLDEAESWRVAKILIDNELFKRDADPFSREAIKLVDLVYSRYYPDEGVGGLQ